MPQSCIPNDATVLKSIGMRILYFSFEVPFDPKEALNG